VAHQHAHGPDEYLETIYFLAFPVGEYGPATTSSAIASRVADMLGVTRASAGEMLRRLENEGLIERGEHKQAILTPLGVERAGRVVRKHRLIERFLTDFMGYTPAESHEHADSLGAAFDDDMIERINERLGHPERCPHGWPVDTDQEIDENLRLLPLGKLDVGATAAIVRLAEHDGDLLHWFYREGLTPGRTIEITDRTPAAGEIGIRLDGTPRTLSDPAANGLYVLPV
jgi:DtxR family Mn-dependent transcriptional regulator